MDELDQLKTAAKQLANAVGAVTSAASASNRSPGSEGAKRWWEKKVQDLHTAEDDLYEFLQSRRENR